MTVTAHRGLSVALRLTGTGPLFAARRAADADPSAPSMLRLVDDTLLLHGWHSADTTVHLLSLVCTAATVLPYSAAVHAARVLEPDAPGSAALCGLARALHTRPHRHAELVGAVRAAAADRLARADTDGLAPVAVRALDTVVRLADTAPDDPAALAPLFLRLYRLPAGAEVRLPDNLPTLVLAGTADLTPGAGVDLAVGGLDARRGPLGSADVVRFTDALRAAPPVPQPAPRAVPQPAREPVVRGA